MNFFGKGKPAAASDESLPVAAAPTSADPAMAPTGDAPDLSAAPPAPVPDGAAPPEEAPGKKSRFPRFKISLPSRKPAAAAVDTDVSEATAALSEAAISAPLVDPAKAARRAARRAARNKLEEEWEEEQRKRKNQAVLTNLPMEPLTPLPEFHSASEDERDEPEAVTVPPPDAVVAEGISAPPPAPAAAPQAAQHAVPSMQGPYIPSSPAHYEEAPGAPMPGAPLQTAPGPYLPSQPDHMQPPAQQGAPAPPPRNPAAEAQMAEMFGMQAYAGVQYQPSAPPAEPYQGEAMPAQGHAPQQGGLTRAPTNPTPIGWGGVYSSFPSQPMYGTPTHLSGAAHGPQHIEFGLAEKIRRGRELAALAVVQDEQGNLGAAENGYMKALELLVPASKELDAGSELSKNFRMDQKGKIQRESAAMLDRCEELRRFLKANGPAVPLEMPSIPVVRPPGPGKGSGGGAPQPPPSPKFEADVPKSTASVPPSQQARSPGVPLPSRPPPPPPPAFEKDSEDDLFQRLASRKNVVNAPEGGISGRVAPAAPDVRPLPSSAKCFMCNAPAELKTKCGHAFCTKCGNQAASVFGKCPVPSCGAPLNSGEFIHIA